MNYSSMDKIGKGKKPKIRSPVLAPGDAVLGTRHEDASVPPSQSMAMAAVSSTLNKEEDNVVDATKSSHLQEVE